MANRQKQIRALRRLRRQAGVRTATTTTRIPLTGSGSPTSGSGWVSGKKPNAPRGSIYVDYTTANIYINVGTAKAPIWTLQGTMPSSSS